MKGAGRTKGPGTSFCPSLSWQSLISGPSGVCIAAQHPDSSSTDGPSAHEMQPWRGAALELLMASRYLKTQPWPDPTLGLTQHKSCWVTAAAGDRGAPFILPTSRESLSDASDSNRFFFGRWLDDHNPAAVSRWAGLQGLLSLLG